MPPVGFEPTISAGEWPKTYALDRAATGTGIHYIHTYINAHPRKYTLHSTYTHINIPNTNIHTYIHKYIHTYISTYIHKHIHIHTHTHIHTHMHTYIHTYIHTHIYTPLCRLFHSHKNT